jgi:prepilin-type N-terminal cleavage/methylation domain-containing protein
MKCDTESGFTLIEVVIAMCILAIGITAMYNLQFISLKGNASANRITYQSTWASDQIETLVQKNYGDSDLDDKDGDGTNQDNNKNGIDDRDEANGSNIHFGLYDVGTDADGSTVTADGLYTVSWNVAQDQPVRNSKTINVIVEHNINRKMIQMQYVKSDPLY